MKKKIFSLFTGTLLAANILSVPALALSDIDAHWCGSVIEKWVDAEKISGYPDGSFKPDSFITRAEFAKILASILPEMPYPDKVLFEDVSESDWFYDSVAKLQTLGVISADTHFNPAREITRQEAMTMAGRAFYYSSENADALKFADSDLIADYAKEFVAALYEAGMVSGYEDNTIRPENNITRAESIKILDGFGKVYEKNSLEGIMDRIYKGAEGFDAASTVYQRINEENSQYFLGLESLAEVEQALASEPMITSVAHSVCLVRAKEGTDVEALKEKIRTSVDPRKWICVGVEREEIIVTNIGNLILLVIDGTNPKAIENSFISMTNSLLPKISADENGIILYNGYYMDSLGSLNADSVESLAKNLDSFVKTNNIANAYFAAVPSKPYYINERLETPFDYDKMNALIRSNLSGAKFIDLYGALSLEDYLKSDLHWRQEKTQNVLNVLGKDMGFETDLSTYTQNEVKDFKGYFNKKAEGVQGESLYYLTNSVTDSARIEHYTVTDFDGIYNLSRLESDDPYTMFLSGAAPLITITNTAAESEKELVILGDSYSLSLAPLLAENYKTVTIVDLRLIAGKIVNEFVTLADKDVLMLYSDAVINNSMMLKF